MTKTGSTTDWDDTEKLIRLSNHLNDIKSYHKVHLKFTSFGYLLADKDIKQAWCKKHCNDEFYGYFNTWYFKSEQDYVMFLMRFGEK
jgi:hypothetical protein